MITYVIDICIWHNRNAYIFIIVYNYVQCNICVKWGLPMSQWSHKIFLTKWCSPNDKIASQFIIQNAFPFWEPRTHFHNHRVDKLLPNKNTVKTQDPLDKPPGRNGRLLRVSWLPLLDTLKQCSLIEWIEGLLPYLLISNQ